MTDIESLKEDVRYDADTGLLYWKPRARGRFDSTAGWESWNRRFAGQPAFHTMTKFKSYAGNYQGVRIAAARVVFMLHHGRMPVGGVRHLNKDKQDNRPCNLVDDTPQGYRAGSDVVSEYT